MIYTVKVVELDPARLVAVATYVPAYEIPVMADLVSVEFAFGGPSPVFVIVSPSTPFIRVSVELCVHTMLSSARLKSVNTAVST